MPYPTNCPFCKKGNLSVFDRSIIEATLTCSSCDRLIVLKTGTGKLFEAALPALSVLISLISVAAFFGITDIGKMKAKFHK